MLGALRVRRPFSYYFLVPRAWGVLQPLFGTPSAGPFWSLSRAAHGMLALRCWFSVLRSESTAGVDWRGRFEPHPCICSKFRILTLRSNGLFFNEQPGDSKACKYVLVGSCLFTSALLSHRNRISRQNRAFETRNIPSWL